MERGMQFSNPTPVESYFLKQSGHKFRYAPVEKVPIVEVSNFPAMGQVTALRFLEWVQRNPEGVISLPTGKTPEYFIRFVEYYLKNWHLPKVRELLERVEIDPGIKPKTEGLQFVQIDEFFPIMPTQHNSFFDYVQKYYLRNFGIPEDRAQLIDATQLTYPGGHSFQEVWPDLNVDLSLRVRHPKTRLERLQKESIEVVDQFCTNYEEQIRTKGGIGFFLGGIGPDGHIAFNVRGSDYFSTTRLMPTNFETQAAAATDLGGIIVAKNRLVITIGLDTIAYNPDVAAIIFAAGEAKAKIVADAVQLPAANTRPGALLQRLKNARFYITTGAALNLDARKEVTLDRKKTLSTEDVEREIIDLSLKTNTRLTQLTEKQAKADPLIKIVLKKTKKPVKELAEATSTSILNKLQTGLTDIEGETFLHTAPHHDDIMLGYLAHVVHIVRTPKNKHHFTYMTSGFNAVTNEFVLNHLQNVLNFLGSEEFLRLREEDYFNPDFKLGWTRDVYHYLDGVAARSQSIQDEAAARRLIRILLTLYEYETLETLPRRIEELQQYFENQYPGQKDLPHVQRLKGRIREWEADLVWGHYGFDTDAVHHMRLGFYKGDIFTEEPTVNRDVMPILRLMEAVKPTVVTLALDPEASGPDTHYKVLQAIAEALRLYTKKHPKAKIKVWGYRNVWYRFHPSDANIFVPVSLNSMSILHNTFHNCFASQTDAPFPSYEHDGPFSDLAQAIHVEQHQRLKINLGSDFWYNNDHPRLRATHGVLFLKEMELDEFYTRARALRDVTEHVAL
ncbi:MAG: glucosamine-6-phosphate deaminase [Lentisphaeria bacterium]|nr:glucosamine-6-phosphate deaminase [Candidatus Neomarinimicrobiota bacterium]MCF7843032.1 glucosamine-6-phosphate deaminase [Lentisphaeria bacterium]